MCSVHHLKSPASSVRQETPGCRLKAGMGERGDVLLAPGVPGEIILLNLDGAAGAGWKISKGSFLGCDQSINIHVVAQGLAKGCCSGLGACARLTCHFPILFP